MLPLLRSSLCPAADRPAWGPYSGTVDHEGYYADGFCTQSGQ